jgi:FkbM family methyltransferase
VECLERNLEVPISRGIVSIEHAGAWSEDTILTLSVNAVAGSHNSFVRNEKGGAVQVHVLTLDEICLKHQLSAVDFVKIDTEGAEAEVIRGSAALIQKFTPRIAIATEHFDGNADAVCAELRRHHAYKLRKGMSITIEGKSNPETIYASR